MDEKKEHEQKEVKKCPCGGKTQVEKSFQESPDLSAIRMKIDAMSAILDRLVESDAKVHSTMEKGDTMVDEATTGTTVGDVVKANTGASNFAAGSTTTTTGTITFVPPVVTPPVVDVTQIVKAQTEEFQKALISLTEKVETLSKANTEKDTVIKALNDKIEKMETEVIKKGGQVVVIPEQLSKADSAQFGMTNAEAVAKASQERK